MTTGQLDHDDIQGNILRGYGHGMVRYLVLEVANRDAARGFLAAAAQGGGAGVPAITRERTWTSRPAFCFNVGLTFAGLRALGVRPVDLATFPTEFREGMAHRAAKLGDTGTSAPAHWPAPFDAPDRVHVIASIYADAELALDQVETQVARAFHVLGSRDGRARPDDKVFFGYRDSISEPRFADDPDPGSGTPDEPSDPLGTLFLGQPSLHETVRFGVPAPQVLGRNGTFNAFRVLAQDCMGFESWLDAAAGQIVAAGKARALLDPGGEWWTRDGLDRTGALREIVAAQMCGRWRNGTPVESSPDTPYPDRAVSPTNFDYNAMSRCPAGAHMRRCNPRGGPIVQRMANYTRRLVRRGMPYGPDFDPARPDPRERGLLGNFIGASIGAQFEAVMCDWLNLGLQDPNVTGSNDPMIGANDPHTSWFDMVLPDGGRLRLHGLPRFVTTRGGAYTFLPSLPALRFLAGDRG